MYVSLAEKKKIGKKDIIQTTALRGGLLLLHGIREEDFSIPPITTTTYFLSPK